MLQLENMKLRLFLDTKFDEFNSRFTLLSGQFDGLHRRLQHIQERMEALTEDRAPDQSNLDRRMASLEERMSSIERRS